jgi:ABC-type thiamine transport system ATPase subunit
MPISSRLQHPLLSGRGYGRAPVLKLRVRLMDNPFGALDKAARLAMRGLLNKTWPKSEATVIFARVRDRWETKGRFRVTAA